MKQLFKINFLSFTLLPNSKSIDMVVMEDDGRLKKWLPVGKLCYYHYFNNLINEHIVWHKTFLSKVISLFFEL